MINLLHINSSARYEDSATRQLTDRLVERLKNDRTTVTNRDLGKGVPLLNQELLGAMFTSADKRDDTQKDQLSIPNELIEELVNADVVVIGLPIYNFGPPAMLKAWADLIARAGETFSYTEQGPVGLVADKPAYIVIASGGVPIGSEADFASSWLSAFLSFLGITSITVVPAGQLNMDPEGAMKAAQSRIDEVTLPTFA